MASYLYYFRVPCSSAPVSNTRARLVTHSANIGALGLLQAFGGTQIVEFAGLHTI
jgi:hypothetical protein